MITFLIGSVAFFTLILYIFTLRQERNGDDKTRLEIVTEMFVIMSIGGFLSGIILPPLVGRYMLSLIHGVLFLVFFASIEILNEVL